MAERTELIDPKSPGSSAPVVEEAKAPVVEDKKPAATADQPTPADQTTQAGAEIDPGSLLDLPGAGTDLDNPAELDGLIEQTAAEDLDGGIGPAEQTDSSLSDHGGLAYDDVELDTDPSLIDEELFTSEAPVGGLDGRNDADSGVGGPGASGDPGSSGPDAYGGWQGGLEGSAGKLSESQRAVLKMFDEQAKEAAARGDEEAVSNVADQTQQFLIDEGVKQEAPDVLKAGAGALTGNPVETNADGEVLNNSGPAVTNPGGTLGEFADWLSGNASTEHSEALRQATDEADRNAAAKEDYGEGSAGLPDHVADPASGDWIDEYESRKWDLETGGGITDPTDEINSINGPAPSNDGSDFVAEYEAGYAEPEYDDTPPDSHLDWEFGESGA